MTPRHRLLCVMPVPLIHLDEVECVELLADFPQVLVSLAVWDEVAKHRPAALTHSAVRFHKVTATEVLSTELDVLSRLLGLHRGEQEALQVAQTRPGCLVLTDDTAARLAARNLRLATHGTIGVLLRAIRRKQKSKDEVVIEVSSYRHTVTHSPRSVGRNYSRSRTI